MFTVDRLKPMLILVSGQPASGKSTLAKQLGRELGMPCLYRDDLTANLADLLTSRDAVRTLADKRPIASASFAAFYAVVSSLLQSGESVIAETNFGRGLAERSVQPLLERARGAAIYCYVPRALSVSRFQERAVRRDRHWFFRDDLQLERLKRGEVVEPWETALPMDLDTPLSCVDTSDGYDPDFESILRFIRSC
jgi:predicted kinase